MKKTFNKIIFSLFVVLFILTSFWMPSYGKVALLPEDMPLTELKINHSLNLEKTISIPLYFNEKNLSFNSNADGIELILDGCKNMNTPDLPNFPYFEKEIMLPENAELIYIKTKDINVKSIPFPKNAYFKLAERPEPIMQPNKDLEGMNSLLQGNDILRQENERLTQESGWKSPKNDKKNGFLIDTFGNDRGRQNLSEIFPDKNFDYCLTPDNNGKKLSLFINPVYFIRTELILTNYILIEVGLAKREDSYSKQLTDVEESGNLSIILTPDEFYSEANLLKSIQESSGYKVNVVQVSQITNYREAAIPDIRDVKGYKDAEEEDKKILKNYNYSLARKIISYLQELLNGKNINYLTIFGDGSKIPPSYYVLSSDNFNDYDKWVPTDIFYSAPNLNGKDYPIEISVGRLPARDKDEAKDLVNKMNRYTKNFSTEWFKNIALMCGDPFGGDYMGELFLSDCINKDYFEGMNVKKYFKTQGKFNKENALNCLENEKVGFIYEEGHGGGDTLYLEPGTIDSNEVFSFKEKSELPIFISVACGNGAYDTMVLDTQLPTNKYLKYPTSFSEALVLSKGGAIAYIGGARINYSGWSLRYKNGVPLLDSKYYMDAILDYFFDNYHKEKGSLGDIAKYALIDYADESMGYINYADIKTFFGFTLLGDPTIKLPFYKSDFKSKIPEISLDKEYRLTPSNIPLFPIDDGVQISASTDSPELQYIFSDYINPDTPLLEEGEFNVAKKNNFYFNFNKLIKSTLVIRVETKDFKENRIVFFGRYWHDLVFATDYDLTRLKVGENKDYVAILRNDGINDESNIVVTIKNNGSEVKSLHFDKIPFLQSRYIQYSCNFTKPGNINLEIIAPELNGEKITADNVCLNNITVSDSDVIRIGVLAQSYYIDWNYVNTALNIKELNKKLCKDNLPIEIFPIIFGRDAQTNTTLLERLDIDMLILYTNDFCDYPINTYLSEIENFSEDGGIVLGIMNLSSNSFGFNLKEVNPLFGLNRDEEFEFKELENPKEVLEVKDKELFDKNEFNITTRYTLIPKDKNGWGNVALKSGELIGLSKSGNIGLIKNGNKLLYSGFLSWKDLVSEDDTYNFFISLLKSTLKLRTDFSISKVCLSPGVGIKNNKGILNISVKNCGNTIVKDIDLLINPINEIIKIETLKGKEEKDIKYEINLKGFAGRKKFEIILDPENKINEFNENNNKMSVCYNVLGQGEPDVEPELTLNIPDYLEVTDEELLVEGKSNPFAKIYFQGNEVSKNIDGTFKKLITLLKGENVLSFTAKEGSLETDKEIKVILKKNIELILKISDKYAFINNELKTLDEAPLILNSITFVPLRFISEAFGAEVNWIKEENKIVINFKDITLIMWIGRDKAELNGKELKLPSVPFIGKSGRTFVPLRIISEVFGAEVNWNSANSTITIKLKVDYKEDSQLNLSNLFESESDEVSSTVLIDAAKPPEDVIFPSCFDIWEDEIYVSTYKGIYILDKELKIKGKIDYPSSLEEKIDPTYFRALTSTISKSFLRVTEEYLIFSDGYNIYIFDKESKELKKEINDYYYGSLLKPLRYFSAILDLEIYDNKLFILDLLYGINVIDINTGELLAKYNIYDFLTDMDIASGNIYATTLFGEVYKIGLNGEDLKSIGIKGTVLSNSILATDDFIYLSLYYPEYIVYKINTINGEIAKEYKLSGTIGQYLDKFLILDDNIYALGVKERNSSSYIYEEKLFKLDKNFKLLEKIGSDGYNKVKSDNKFLINPEYVWYTQDGDYLLSQYYPLNPNYFKLYSKDGNLTKTFSITPLDNNWMKVYSQVCNNIIGTLFIDFMTYKYNFEISEFTSKGTVKSKNVELKPKTEYYDFFSFSFNDKLIVAPDYYTGDIIEFDINSGEEVNRFNISLAEEESSLYFPYSIKLINDKIYIFDFVKKISRTYSLEGNILNELNLSLFSQEEKIKLYTDIRLKNENEIAIIDSEKANILMFDSEALKEIMGEEKKLSFEDENEVSTELGSFYLPYSFDLKDDSVIINDLGNFRVFERPYLYTETGNLPCKIELSKENIDVVSYTKNPLESQVLVEIFNSTSQLEILEKPSWVSVEKFDASQRNILLTFKIDPKEAEIDELKSGTITFKVSDTLRTLTINLQMDKNTITFYDKSSLIMGSDKNYISNLPAELRKGIILLSDDTLRNVFGFDVKKTGDEIVILTESFATKLKIGDRSGSLLLPSNTVKIDLGEKVEEKNGILFIPINTILNFLNIHYTIDGELIKIFLT